MLSWNQNWNGAFEKRDPALAAKTLQEILAVAGGAAGSEKAHALLAAVTCEAILRNEKEARNYLDEARGFASDKDFAFQMNADFLDASLHSRKGDFQQALSILDQLLKRHPSQIIDPQFRYLYEQVQFTRGIVLAELQRFLEAEPLLLEAQSFDLVQDDRSLLYFHLGTCYFVKEDYKSALHFFAEAKKIGLGPNYQGGWHFYVGRAYYRLKDYRNAKREFLKTEECIKAGLAGPESSDLYKLLAYSCKGLRQTAEAEMYSSLATTV